MNDNRIALLEEKITRLEQELETSHGMLETANSIIIRWDKDGIIRYVNEFGSRFFGYAAGEMHGQNVMIIVPEVEQSTGRDLAALVKDIVRNPQRFKSVWSENITRDGRTVWVTWTNEAILDEQGAVREVLAIGNDITMLKEAERALEEAHQFNELIINNSPIGLLVFKESGPCVLTNPAAETIAGASREQLLKLNYRDMESYRESGILADMEEALKKGDIIQKETHVRNTFGKKVWIDGIITSFEMNQKKNVLFLFNDIMERKSLEQSLIRGKEQWEETFDAISDAVAIIDEHHRIIRANEACADLIALPVKEIIGKHCHALVHGTDCPIPDCPGERAFLSKQRESMEFQTADGRWLWITVEPIRGDYTEAGHYVHIVRDVSAVKQQEQELIAARKAEAFSVLSGGIAHDYNNLLAVIWGNLSLARKNIENEKALHLLESAEMACKTTRDLTHQFITLSKASQMNKSLTDIDGVLTAALECIDQDRSIEVAIDRSTDQCMVEADEHLLTYALERILINAVEAMPEGGKLHVSVQTSTSDRSGEGRELSLVFADTGQGISSTDRPKVFDPYFTTKPMGAQKGLGMGLAVSKSIIEKHGGRLDIDSTPGQGTTVAVRLPLEAGSDQVKKLPEGATQPVVLLLEDDDLTRKTVKRMLEHCNCAVLTAAHGQGAIDIYRQAKRSNQEIDLVMLDLTAKAGTSGTKILQELRKLGYARKALVISGSPNSPALTNFREHGFDDALVKPFAVEDLQTVLSEHLPINDKT